MTALVKLEAAKRALTEARTIDEVKEIRDQATALHLYAKQAGMTLEMQNDIAEIKLRAERRAGELLAEIDKHEGGRPTENQLHDVTGFEPPKLEDLGISRIQSHRWQLEAKVPEEVFEQHLAETRAAREEITSVGLRRLARGLINNKEESKSWWQSSEGDDWWTPQWLFDLVDGDIGFELDVCASDANRKCERYFSREQDGLVQEWTGKCWMNPPYGRSGGVSIYNWIEKAYRSAKKGATVACFIPARTDTLWWWDFCIYGEIRFLKGRIRFENSDSTAPFPSAVVIFWPFVPESKAEVIWWDVKGGEDAALDS